jgi:hypothetical protein
MVQAVSHWPLTAEDRVRARVDPFVGFMDKVALGQVFLIFFGFPLPISFHHCSIFICYHEVCDSSDQAAHYRHLGPKLGALYLTRHFG